ncbi:neutral zinc metallopeptidase [Corynebacterium bovis]|uniref:KPN_02809 family neutral zinc metallopeptidase n=1 Tax=Corynebacterium bovis TaxID=36808 RepID=UPI003080A6EB
MTFNGNIQGSGGRSSSGGGGGAGGGLGGGGFGGGGGGMGGLLIGLLLSRGGRGGVVGLIVVAAVLFFMNGGASMFSGGSGDTGQGTDTAAECRTVDDFNTKVDCRIDGTATSLDRVWGQVLPAEAGIRYTQPDVLRVSGQTRTGCGAADATASGPFYCPSDTTVYIGTGFFDQLARMGGSDGPFSQMYVLAHEFGHHIQKLQGTIGLSDYNNPGPDSNALKMELQADCYAGLWASHADQGDDAVLEPLTQDQVEQAVTSAKAIGDDAIQSSSGRGVDPGEWTHGSSEQRRDSFLRGYQGGTMASCRADFNR